MKSATIGKRLLSAVKFVRQGAVFADIGTDHAYLPIYLLKMGKIERAVLSDINEGPLASARENARTAGVLDKTELVLTDGASALFGKGITDAAIFGMGGELIARIIEDAPFLKNENIRLILQPMSKIEELCNYIKDNGFSVIGESFTQEGGKFYRTVCIEHGSLGAAVDESFPIIGLSTTPCEEFRAKIGYLSARLSSVNRAMRGKAEAGLDSSLDQTHAQIIKKELGRLKAAEREEYL